MTTLPGHHITMTTPDGERIQCSIVSMRPLTDHTALLEFECPDRLDAYRYQCIYVTDIEIIAGTIAIVSYGQAGDLWTVGPTVAEMAEVQRPAAILLDGR